MKKSRIIKVSFKGLSRNKLRTFLMMLGIVIGITALTIIVSAGLGTRKNVMNLVSKFGLDSIMIFSGPGREMGMPAGNEPTTTLTLEDAAMMKQEIKTIVEVAPFNRIPQREIKFKENYTSAMVFGVTPTWSPVWDWDVTQGEFISDEDMENLKRTCVIAPTVQRDLFGGFNPIGEKLLIGNVHFEIKGIMRSRGISPGGGDMDNRVYIPLSTFMRRLANVDYIFGIKTRIRKTKDIPETVTSVKSLLREHHNLLPSEPDDFSIRTPTEITEMSEKITGTFNIFLALVAGISLIVGGVVITNIMLISVNERRREIGLRKTVGARNKDIKMQFFLEATAVSLIGGVIGIALGIAGAKILETVIKMQTLISWEVIVLGVIFSILVGIIAGVQPAKQAALLDPIESLSQ